MHDCTYYYKTVCFVCTSLRDVADLQARGPRTRSALGGSAYKSVTYRKGGVISDFFAEQREAWANVNWFLAK